MKLGVFNLWTSLHDLRAVTPREAGAALEATPLFDAGFDRQPVPGKMPVQRVRPAAARKRKPVAIVDEITAS